jgi:hypothetical protein
VLLGHVIEHEIDRERDAVVVQHRGELLEVAHAAEVGPHLAVVGHGVAAVVRRRPGSQQRHEVQVGRAQLAQVVDVRGHALESAREAVGVGDVAEGVGTLEPVRAQQPVAVACAQRFGPVGPAGDHDLGEPVEQAVGVVGEHGPHPGLEVGPPPAGAGQQVVDAVGAVEAALAQDAGDPPGHLGCNRCHAHIVVHPGP